MRIVIMAGGKSTRLRPLTDYMPKIMVPIHGKPFLFYLVKRYGNAELVLSVNYLKESIKNWCRQTKNYLEFVEEPEFLGTGGGLRICEPFVCDCKKFIVMNGDTCFDEDIEKIYRLHNSKKHVATVIYAKNKLTREIRNSGFYVFSQEVFKYLKSPKIFKIEDKLNDIPHKIYESKKEYVDIGTFEGLKYAKQNLLKELICV